jgi:hypothetical protein
VGDPYNYQSLGSAYCQNKDYVNGAAEYRITLQTYPRDTTTLDYLAYADTMSRNFVEGEVVALKAVGVSECV